VEKIMKAKAIPFPWRENALALALGLAIIGFSAGWVHAQPPQAQSQIASSELPAPSDFTCHAKPGTYCDLRDWRGFGQPLAQTNVTTNAK
jgi:hypothetical protein